VRIFARLRRSLRKRWLRRKFGEDWERPSGTFHKRLYASYEAYCEHQAAKLGTHTFGNYDIEFRRVLRERLAALGMDWRDRRALCLGARIGTEVKAFLDVGAAASGIDLNPGENNPHVARGDFHNLSNPAGSLDAVYTNSLDHVYDLDRLSAEVLRVLKPAGLFIVEAVNGREHGIHPGFFESLSWESVDDLVRVFENAGFTVWRRTPITAPWPGEQICFQPRT
jgi:SAM-dependent methyltransferase